LRRADIAESPLVEELTREEKVKNRKGLKDFWGKFKVTLIDLFKEEEDQAL
jgi:cell division protein FtsA